MALSSNALITADTYYQAARIPHKSRDEELLAQTEFAINAASEWVETHCNRTFLSGSMATDVFDGMGYDDLMSHTHSLQALQEAPITTSPHAPRLYNYSGGSWTLVTTDSLTYDATEGTIYFAGASDYEVSAAIPGQLGGSGYYFERGKDNYKVEYWYGYSGRSNIPYDLQIAVAMVVKMNELSLDNMGIQSSSTSDGISHTYTLNSLPLVVQQTLNKYVR